MKHFDIKWLSTCLLIICGTMIALKLPYMQYAFLGFVIAHGILTYYFYIIHPNKPLLIQNVYFLFLNSTASYVWLFKG